MLFKKTVKLHPQPRYGWWPSWVPIRPWLSRSTTTAQNTAATTATFAAETLTGTGPAYNVQNDTLLQATGKFGTLTGVINKSERIYLRLDVGACWPCVRRRL